MSVNLATTLMQLKSKENKSCHHPDGSGKTEITSYKIRPFCHVRLALRAIKSWQKQKKKLIISSFLSWHCIRWQLFTTAVLSAFKFAEGGLQKDGYIFVTFFYDLMGRRTKKKEMNVSCCRLSPNNVHIQRCHSTWIQNFMTFLRMFARFVW